LCGESVTFLPYIRGRENKKEQTRLSFFSKGGGAKSQFMGGGVRGNRVANPVEKNTKNHTGEHRESGIGVETQTVAKRAGSGTQINKKNQKRGRYYNSREKESRIFQGCQKTRAHQKRELDEGRKGVPQGETTSRELGTPERSSTSPKKRISEGKKKKEKPRRGESQKEYFSRRPAGRCSGGEKGPKQRESGEQKREQKSLTKKFGGPTRDHVGRPKLEGVGKREEGQKQTGNSSVSSTR